jgi:predicted glycosyltransferase involved in capsule biosynthesis
MSALVTLCLPYYMNPGMLELHYRRIRSLSGDLRASLAVIVVDDGSPDGEAQPADIGCPLAIYRVGVDVRWNQDSARNIAAHEATSRWLLLTDIDHLVPEQTFARIILEKLQKQYVYRFARTTLAAAPGSEKLIETPYKPHPNSWLLTRRMYWSMGGYDERFAGYYGTDADFRDRLSAVATNFIALPERIIRVPRETQADASTTTYQRKAPEDGANIRRIKTERHSIENWKPLALSFPYRRIHP